MASPGILDITYSLVGSVDSTYYGVNVLDSASFLIDDSAEPILHRSADDNFLTFPHSLAIHSITTSNNLVSGSGGGGSGSGGGEAATTTERWY